MSTVKRLFIIGFLIAAICSEACGSCESCGTSGEATKDVAPSDTATSDVPTDTRADMVERAADRAELHAERTAIDRISTARFMAAELEGRQKEVDSPTVKRSPAARSHHQDNGTIDKAKLLAVFARNQSGLQKCYERALKNHQGMHGQVSMSIRIGAGGKAAMVSARSNDIDRGSTLDCMKRLARSWTYPPPRGGTVLVHKTFSFVPQN